MSTSAYIITKHNDYYRLSLFFKNNNPQEFMGEDYQEHIFRDKTPDSIVTIRNK